MLTTIGKHILFFFSGEMIQNAHFYEETNKQDNNRMIFVHD